MATLDEITFHLPLVVSVPGGLVRETVEDGYLDPDRAIRFNYLLRGVVVSSSGSELRFDPIDVLKTPDSTSRVVASILRRASAIQVGLFAHLDDPRLPSRQGSSIRHEVGGTAATDTPSTRSATVVR
ncbi:MAG: hypothetical protein ACT4P7_14275 [Gemmatimonadaceae bacterium]